MKITVVSIPVLDQAKAHKFYTEKLGFTTKHDIDLGQGHRWLTLLSPDDPEGPEILLEPAPAHFEAAKVYYSSLYESGIPVFQFSVDSADETYERLSKAGVNFKMEPKDVGTAKIAMFDDTCGNYIQIVEEY